ncbi:type III secretion system protein PrgM [Lactococcus garvieae]|uniref:type III secretion system protein PrgM n=1 Tax=Lactococcus garvieae TaxID=1363 RepID=UPI00254C74F9|nr:type III secretion system protein PrgM [Lactococcus garvieae]
MKSKLLIYEEKISKIEKELKKFNEQQLALKHKIKNKTDEYERTRAEYVSALLVENNMTLSDLTEMFVNRNSIGGE